MVVGAISAALVVQRVHGCCQGIGIVACPCVCVCVSGGHPERIKHVLAATSKEKTDESKASSFSSETKTAHAPQLVRASIKISLESTWSQRDGAAFLELCCWRQEPKDHASRAHPTSSGHHLAAKDKQSSSTSLKIPLQSFKQSRATHPQNMPETLM